MDKSKFAYLVHALCLFKALRLFFLTNLPGPTVIPCPTSIPDSRVTSDVVSVGIFRGTFPFSSPGTFGLLWSRDNRTTGPSKSLGPVLSQDLGPLVPGLPGTYLESYLKKKSIQKYMFFYFGKFFYWQNY